MDTLDALRLFVGIAEVGSLSAAARQHSVATSTATAALQQLEKQAGTTLIRRSTRRLSFTHEGLQFLSDARKLLADWDASIGGVKEGPLRGPIKMTSTVNFGRSKIVPAIDRFMELHPGISIDLHISDTVIDLVEHNIDLAIRNGPLRDSSLIARLILRGQRVVCAAPSYWDTHGVPLHPEDLASHTCLMVSRPGTTFSTWRFMDAGKMVSIRVSGNRVANDGSILKRWALKGYGVFLSPVWDISEELASSALVTALDGFLPDNANLYAVTDGSAVSHRVRALIDFLVDELHRG
ncbi:MULTISPECIES: LysR family transcriptional regulator [unclassified Rhizobium]|uniref:LysR family transcriptional regulator n=1 Tax=unclassified Rhizobium TaxID=2613769 RepID=UPI000EA8D05A|nr:MULTISPECIES: LysR family transcriptional regulator [unclassified Rhizobium]AYG70068.1 LysR family transcriptional regulator [Rhizobium sp. CCGE531]AYG76443.1 LysR family transcriptional regulator [Rhizobium sp. CCGE532]